MDMHAALKLQQEWGADEALDAAPVDRRGRPAMIVPVVPGSASARVAAAAESVEALRAAVAGFACPLATTATNLVFAEGNPAAGLVVVGEAPGAEEDSSGRPFMGAEGRFLDAMFGSIGLTRDDMLLTMLIPWRPPGGRPVSESEVELCLPFLRRHLALVRPRVVVSLGALCTRALSGRDDGIRRLRGRWLTAEIEGVQTTLLPMLHPAYTLRHAAAKRESWTDLCALRQRLAGYSQTPVSSVLKV